MMHFYLPAKTVALNRLQGYARIQAMSGEYTVKVLCAPLARLPKLAGLQALDKLGGHDPAHRRLPCPYSFPPEQARCALRHHGVPVFEDLLSAHVAQPHDLGCC